MKNKPQHTEMILSLQYWESSRKSEEYAQEWMARLQIKATECKDQENKWRLNEQFISAMNNEAITVEIIKVLMALQDTIEVSSEQVLV